MNLIEKIDARFRSGNSVPVTRANITAEEWEALKKLPELMLIETALHNQFVRRLASDTDFDHEASAHQVLGAAASVRDALAAITE